MTDLVLVPVPGLGTLALSREAFAEALAAGAEMIAAAAPSSVASTPSTEPLLDADQAGAQMCVSGRWLEESARAGIIPHVRLGKYLRFRVSEIAAHCRVKGAPPPRAMDSESVGHIRRHARQ